MVGVAGQRDDLVFWIWCLGGHSVNEGVFTRVWRVEAEGRRGGVLWVDGAPLESLDTSCDDTERTGVGGTGRSASRDGWSARGCDEGATAVLHRSGSDPGRSRRAAGRARGRRTVRVCSPSRPPPARRRPIESPVENLPARAHRRRRVTPATKPRRPRQTTKWRDIDAKSSVTSGCLMKKTWAKS